MAAGAIKNNTLILIWQIPNHSFPTPFPNPGWLMTSTEPADSVNSASICHPTGIAGLSYYSVSDFTGVLLELFSWYRQGTGGSVTSGPPNHSACLCLVMPNPNASIIYINTF